MTDALKFDIFNLVYTNNHVLGVSHSIILQHLYEQQMDIKTANTYINVLLEEGWLIKNIHSLAAYNLSDKAVMWLHQYKSREPEKVLPNWEKRNFVNGVIGTLLAIIGILVSIILYQCSVNNSQHNKDAPKQHYDSSKQTPKHIDTSVRVK